MLESYRLKCNAIMIKCDKKDNILIFGDKRSLKKSKLLFDTIFSESNNLNKIYNNSEEYETSIEVNTECTGLLIGAKFKNIKEYEEK